MTGVAWFLLCVARPQSKGKPLVLGVSVGGVPGGQPLSPWYVVVCLLDEWGLPHECGGTRETVKGLEKKSAVFRCSAQGWGSTMNSSKSCLAGCCVWFGMALRRQPTDLVCVEERLQ